MSLENCFRKLMKVEADDLLDRGSVRGGFCLGAAIDSTTPTVDLPHSAYDELGFIFNAAEELETNTSKLARAVYHDMREFVDGRSSSKSIAFRRARTGREFETVFDKAKMGGKRVLAVTSDKHIVGVEKVGSNAYRFVGDTPLVREVAEIQARDLIDRYEGGWVDEGEVHDLVAQGMELIERYNPVLTTDEVVGRLVTCASKGKRSSVDRRKDRRINNLVIF